ncbi:MAG: PrsW family intramembrane metalloprotease, partial [Prolixibacteraceae bacterium]|nr:PrsW family intramembrane metalloprotease [Prolixibacteraceae bacterium]
MEALLIIALAPVVIIGAYIYYRDKYNREPIWLLIKALIAGGIIVIPILFLEHFLSLFQPSFPGITGAAYRAFVVAAFSEETFKFLALLLTFWKSKYFNEKFDGIVYATFISLGFAAVENVLYVAEGGLSTGMVRAITAVPAHAIFGITMGFYTGLAKFYVKETRQHLQKAILIPIFLHGVYDFILMTGIEWLLIFWLAFVVYLYISGLKRIKFLSEQSFYKTDYDLLNKTF